MKTTDAFVVIERDKDSKLRFFLFMKKSVWSVALLGGLPGL